MSDPKPLDTALLLDWLEHRLADDEARQVAERVAAADARTRATVAWLRAFLQASTVVTLDAPPPAVRAMLMQRFAAYTRERRPGVLRRLAAALTFDSGAAPALAGVRGVAETGARRQLIYTSEAADLALNIVPRPADQLIDLVGQVFAKDALADPIGVRLLRGVEAVASAEADDLGEWSIAGVAPGEYALVLGAGTLDVIIAPVDIRR